MTRCREEGLCRGDSRALWGRGSAGCGHPALRSVFGGAQQRNVGPCALRGTGDADCRVGSAGLLAMTEVDRLSFRGAKRRGNPFHFQRGTGRRVVGPYALFGARDAARRGRRALRGTRRGVVTPPYGAFWRCPAMGRAIRHTWGAVRLIFGSQISQRGAFRRMPGWAPSFPAGRSRPFPCRPEGTAGRAFRARPPHL